MMVRVDKTGGDNFSSTINELGALGSRELLSNSRDLVTLYKNICSLQHLDMILVVVVQHGATSEGDGWTRHWHECEGLRLEGGFLENLKKSSMLLLTVEVEIAYEGLNLSEAVLMRSRARTLSGRPRAAI